MKRFSAAALPLLVIAAGISTSLQAQETPLDRLKHELMCTCGCPHQLGQCGDECGVAPKLIAEVEGLLAEQSEAEVYRTMEARYGAMIYAAPRAEGWGLAAWLLPAVAVLFGGLFLWGFLKRASTPAASEEAPLSPKDREKYRRLLQQELGRR